MESYLTKEDIVDVEITTADEVYDLTVADNHNYILDAGKKVLVHNSGKTFLLIMMVLSRAYKYPGTRHVIVRYRLNHIKQSIWHGTLPEVAEMMGITYKENKADWFVTLPNGSEIWIGGLDDKERTEKILGNEYATIYINEASQVSYNSFSLLKTRLNPPKGVPAKFFIDYNPPSKRHWGYIVFHQLRDPLTGEAVIKEDDYAWLSMNPRDNLDNLSEGYLETLESLSERDRERFLEGHYLDPVGAIYHRFGEKMIIDDEPECDEYIVGVDLVTYAAVLIGRLPEQVIVIDEIGGEDLIASELNRMIVNRWGKYRYKAFIDWNLSKSGTREFDNSRLAAKGPGSVEAGIDCINKYMENGNFFLHSRCVKSRAEIEDYRRDENGRVIKENDHYCDAIRYAVFSTERSKANILKY